MSTPVRTMIALKRQSTRDTAEHDDGLTLVPLAGSIADRTEVVASSERADGPRLSVVVPAMNEEGNIPALHRAIADVLDATGTSFELI